MGNRNNDVLEAIQNNLDDGVKYNSVYDIINMTYFGKTKVTFHILSMPPPYFRRLLQSYDEV